MEDHPTLKWGTHGFTVAGWVHTSAQSGDVIGDVIGKFDAEMRTGLHLGILTNTGVTSTAQPNYRNLHFGIDSGRQDARWDDCGRPGNAVLIAGAEGLPRQALRQHPGDGRQGTGAPVALRG